MTATTPQGVPMDLPGYGGPGAAPGPYGDEPAYPTPYAPREPAEGAQHVAQSLLAAGEAMDFADGRRRVLRYDFLSLLAIEEEYGSIKALLDAVEPKEVPEGERTEWDSLATPILGVVADLVRFGLYDEELHRHLTRLEVAPLLLPSLLGEYVETAARSVAQAFGPKTPPSKDGRPVDPTIRSTGSRGGHAPPSTGSQIASGG